MVILTDTPSTPTTTSVPLTHSPTDMDILSHHIIPRSPPAGSMRLHQVEMNVRSLFALSLEQSRTITELQNALKDEGDHHISINEDEKNDNKMGYSNDDGIGQSDSDRVQIEQRSYTNQSSRNSNLCEHLASSFKKLSSDIYIGPKSEDAEMQHTKSINTKDGVNHDVPEKQRNTDNVSQASPSSIVNEDMRCDCCPCSDMRTDMSMASKSLAANSYNTKAQKNQFSCCEGSDVEKECVGNISRRSTYYSSEDDYTRMTNQSRQKFSGDGDLSDADSDPELPMHQPTSFLRESTNKDYFKKEVQTNGRVDTDDKSNDSHVGKPPNVRNDSDCVRSELRTQSRSYGGLGCNITDMERSKRSKLSLAASPMKNDKAVVRDSVQTEVSPKIGKKNECTVGNRAQGPMSAEIGDGPTITERAESKKFDQPEIETGKYPNMSSEPKNILLDDEASNGNGDSSSTDSENRMMNLMGLILTKGWDSRGSVSVIAQRLVGEQFEEIPNFQFSNAQIDRAIELMRDETGKVIDIVDMPMMNNGRLRETDASPVLTGSLLRKSNKAFVLKRDASDCNVGLRSDSIVFDVVHSSQDSKRKNICGLQNNFRTTKISDIARQQYHSDEMNSSGRFVHSDFAECKDSETSNSGKSSSRNSDLEGTMGPEYHLQTPKKDESNINQLEPETQDKWGQYREKEIDHKPGFGDPRFQQPTEVEIEIERKRVVNVLRDMFLNHELPCGPDFLDDLKRIRHEERRTEQGDPSCTTDERNSSKTDNKHSKARLSSATLTASADNDSVSSKTRSSPAGKDSYVPKAIEAASQHVGSVNQLKISSPGIRAKSESMNLPYEGTSVQYPSKEDECYVKQVHSCTSVGNNPGDNSKQNQIEKERDIPSAPSPAVEEIPNNTYKKPCYDVKKMEQGCNQFSDDNCFQRSLVHFVSDVEKLSKFADDMHVMLDKERLFKKHVTIFTGSDEDMCSVKVEEFIFSAKHTSSFLELDTTSSLKMTLDCLGGRAKRKVQLLIDFGSAPKTLEELRMILLKIIVPKDEKDQAQRFIKTFCMNMDTNVQGKMNQFEIAATKSGWTNKALIARLVAGLPKEIAQDLKGELVDQEVGKMYVLREIVDLVHMIVEKRNKMKLGDIMNK